jgi:hypothetical protein
MKFHLDENVDHAIADGLRRRAINVTTSTDAGLIGASDEAQISFALLQERVIVTHDRDFLRLDSLGVSHSGIAFCPPATRSIGEIVRRLSLTHECLTDSDMRGQVEYL